MRNLDGKLKKGMGKKERRRIVSQALTDPQEKEYYARLYPIFIAALEKTRRVSRAVSELHRLGYATFQELYEFSREFQKACVAAGKPLQTPLEFVLRTNKTNPRVKKSSKRLAPIFDRYSSRVGGGYVPGKHIPDEH